MEYNAYPLCRVKRTSLIRALMSANDPKREPSPDFEVVN